MLQRVTPYAWIVLCALLAYGSILWNGAGFAHPDDREAASMVCCDFRPFLAETYAFNRHVGGWMLTNFALHVIAGWLLFAVSGSLLAAWLFVAHPMAADAVASVAGRSSVLAAVFILLLILSLRFRRRLHSFSLLAGVGILASSLGIPARLLHIPGSLPALEWIYRWISAVGNYIVPRMLVPDPLSADPELVASSVSFALGCVLIAGAVFLFVRIPALRLPVGLMGVGLLPYLFRPLPDVFLEHRAYLALAGAMILVARYLPRTLTIPCLALFILAAHQRADVYHSPQTLWADAAAKAPNVMRPHLNHGAICGMDLDLVCAEKELRLAIALDPKHPKPRKALLAVLVVQGRLSEASRLLDWRPASPGDPGSPHLF